ncbi:5-alpha-L-arabinosidase,Probable arabinan endo-1 [Trichinella pseudospiralis]
MRFAASAIHVTSYSSPMDTLTDDGHLAPSYPIIGYDSAMLWSRNDAFSLNHEFLHKNSQGRELSNLSIAVSVGRPLKSDQLDI